jgi:hypothetical protein
MDTPHPMHHENDLSALFVEIGDHLANEFAHDALLQTLSSSRNSVLWAFSSLDWLVSKDGEQSRGKPSQANRGPKNQGRSEKKHTPDTIGDRDMIYHRDYGCWITRWQSLTQL